MSVDNAQQNSRGVASAKECARTSLATKLYGDITYLMVGAILFTVLGILAIVLGTMPEINRFIQAVGVAAALLGMLFFWLCELTHIIVTAIFGIYR